MRKIQFYGKLFVNGEWVDLNTEMTQFEIPDDIEPAISEGAGEEDGL